MGTIIIRSGEAIFIRLIGRSIQLPWCYLLDQHQVYGVCPSLPFKTGQGTSSHITL